MAKKSKAKFMAILAIVFGILVIIKPELLAYVVGIYLIVNGIVGFMEN